MAVVGIDVCCPSQHNAVILNTGLCATVTECSFFVVKSLRKARKEGRMKEMPQIKLERACNL